jgi:hypothetical protein
LGGCAHLARLGAAVAEAVVLENPLDLLIHLFLVVIKEVLLLNQPELDHLLQKCPEGGLAAHAGQVHHGLQVLHERLAQGGFEVVARRVLDARVRRGLTSAEVHFRRHAAHRLERLLALDSIVEGRDARGVGADLTVVAAVARVDAADVGDGRAAGRVAGGGSGVADLTDGGG